MNTLEWDCVLLCTRLVGLNRIVKRVCVTSFILYVGIGKDVCEGWKGVKEV